ncbi:MAG: ABC transporter ATP-binding protein [Planctomycetes bacterium]|nr:ABC transporter ATP-binding protein [Planctomycetota bacterium]
METEGLTKRYGRAVGIEDLALRVERGEIFGFLGPNGAGKTTTIRLLMAFIRPTSGTARVLGLDPRRDEVAVRARVGYMPGEGQLPGGATGVGLLRRLSHITPRTDPALRARLLERLDLDPTRRIRAMSHGMKRKLLAVQALAHRPELIILDEPTQGMDPLARRELEETVKEARDGGATVFLSSHDLAEVERICDRVGIVRAGRLVLVESVAAIRARTDKVVEIRLASGTSLPPIEGLRVAGRRSSSWSCRYRGDVAPLLRALADVPIEDLSIRPPDLEEFFLSLYQTAATASTWRASDGGASSMPPRRRRSPPSPDPR